MFNVMNAAEVITAILNNEGITPAQLAKDIGIGRPQAIYDILNGKVKTVTSKMADKIKSAKPIYSRDWLISGIGQMIAVDGAEDIPTPPIPPDSMSVIKTLIEINAKKDEELKELRQELYHLTRCFQLLAERYGLPSSAIEKEAM